MTETSSDNFKEPIPKEPAQEIEKPFKQAVMEHIDQVFAKPHKKTVIGYLDHICRRGELSSGHVGRILNLYKRNVMGSLKKYALRFSIFIYNVIDNNEFYMDIEDMADIHNLWHKLGNMRYLSNTELPRLRKKLRAKIDRQMRFFKKKGLKCYIELAEDSNGML